MHHGGGIDGYSFFHEQFETEQMGSTSASTLTSEMVFWGRLARDSAHRVKCPTWRCREVFRRAIDHTNTTGFFPRPRRSAALNAEKRKKRKERSALALQILRASSYHVRAAARACRKPRDASVDDPCNVRALRSQWTS